MNEMSSLEDLLLGENYLARCQQLVNLISLLTNGQLFQQQPLQQQQQPIDAQSLASSMPQSVLQILQHLQDNQDSQQIQRDQFRLQLQIQEEQQRLIQQQQQLQQQRIFHHQQQCTDTAQVSLVPVHRHYHHNHHHQYQSPASNGNGTTTATTTTSSSSSSSLPSSTVLAKLTAATTRPHAQFLATKLDQTIVDFLESIYAINDNPEPAAIDMLSKRLNTTSEAISEWFDETRHKLNPAAGPRSPPAKKRQGGRVVTFSEYQRSLLEAIFDENNYLHPQEYEELSNLIQVPSRNIKIWFKNRHSKQRLSGRVNTLGSLNNSD